MLNPIPLASGCDLHATFIHQVEGAPLELCCLVDSDPMAAVTWYKNDLIFMDDARDDVAEIAEAS